VELGAPKGPKEDSKGTIVSSSLSLLSI